MAYLAPAGTPVTLHDIARGLACGARPKVANSALAESLKKVSGHPSAWPISSGRAAMTIVLAAMRRSRANQDRDEVIVPAYTCYSVPAAIERAGLKLRLCDVDPHTLGMDPAALEHCDFSRTLAVVSASLYGLPDDLAAIEAICRRHGAFMLDDAAQALGAALAGRPVGSFGDAGLYSFDKGKIISTMQGGAIVARDGNVATELASAMGDLPGCALTEIAANSAKLVVYSIFLRPTFYGLARRLPFTGLGRTRYETRFPVTQLSAFQAGLATLLMGRLEELNSTRRRRAHELAEALEDLPGLEPVRLLGQTQPVFARFPLRVMEQGVRRRVIERMDRAGIGATVSYPLSLADVPEVAKRVPAADRNVPGAREVARTILTLPTHSYCGPDLSVRVHRVLAECLAPERSAATR